MTIETMKPAITALNNQLQVLSATATAEETAYLGTAIEKIAGQMTVFDVVQAGSNAQSDINSKKEDSLTAVNTAGADAVQSVSNAESVALTRINAAQPIELSALHAAALSF